MHQKVSASHVAAVHADLRFQNKSAARALRRENSESKDENTSAGDSHRSHSSHTTDAPERTVVVDERRVRQDQSDNKESLWLKLVPHGFQQRPWQLTPAAKPMAPQRCEKEKEKKIRKGKKD